MGLAENTPKSTSTCSEKPYVSHRPRESMKNGHFLMENSAARNDMSRQAMVDDPSGGEFEGSFGFRSFCCRHEKGLHSQWKPHRLIIILKTALNWSIDIPCWDRLADIMINWLYIYIYPNMPISIASLQIIIMTIMSWRSPIIFLVPSSFHPQSLCMISPVCLKVWPQTHSNDLYCAQKMTALFCFFFFPMIWKERISLGLPLEHLMISRTIFVAPCGLRHFFVSALRNLSATPGLFGVVLRDVAWLCPKQGKPKSVVFM